MAGNHSKIIIETMVRKAIKDMKKSPNRTMRNLVDMALQFSQGHFQTQFFQVAQTMLKNRNSCYYSLIPALIADIETERLVRFGMNLGYNSCTYGANLIRETEQTNGYNIPWSIFFHANASTYLTHRENYSRLIRDGKALGIYTWQIFTDGHPEPILSLAEAQEDCAFILYCDPTDLTPQFLDRAAELNNIMLVIRYDEFTPDVYEILWDSGLLYSVYYSYSDQDTDFILSGDLFAETEQLHPLFTALMACEGCSEDTQQSVYNYVKEARSNQNFLTIPWEVVYDNRFVDTIVSGDACSLGFDGNGTIYTMYQRRADLELNLFRDDLKTILKQAFPKELT